jgi:peptidoglycan/xylan/chitin deacetylase (PgdA/CDA1 family)
MRFKPPQFLKRLMPELVWNIPDGEHVFLTFDDGPTPGVTEWILRELARFDMKATFFCLGKNVDLYPDLYQRIIDDGHKVGNHTYSHQKGWEMSTEDYIEDIDLANQMLHSDLFRPPYGRITPTQARELGKRYNIIMWDVLSRDYNRKLRPRTCLNNVIKHVRPGDIVVFHDSEKAFRNLHFALPRTLKYLQDNGLKSKSIEL